MKPYWTSHNGDTTLTIYHGHALEVLRQLPDESVHCVVTSPPYWGLRDYGLPPMVWGGDPECEHEWGVPEGYVGHRGNRGQVPQTKWPSNQTYPQHTGSEQAYCTRCGAWRGSLGLEPTPEMYVQHMVEIFREVRRVLRRDGTAWLNLGDCYASTPPGNKTLGVSEKSTLHGVMSDRYRQTLANSVQQKRNTVVAGLKPKDLVGIPWMVAFALRDDGWYLRADIIWAKPNPMPESVTDRPTKSHEYVFLLSKSPRYYYDADAIREPLSSTPEEYLRSGKSVRENHAYGSVAGRPLGSKSFATVPVGRNKRSVWTIATEPFPEAHFATFPQALVEPMILAGTSPKACPKCGAPWKRVVERIDQGWDGSRYGERAVAATGGAKSGGTQRSTLGSPNGKLVGQRQTVGFRPTCDCPDNDGSGRCVVLDPFVGSGTTLLVAQRLGRNGIGIELNRDYCDIARRRLETEHMQMRLPGVC